MSGYRFDRLKILIVDDNSHMRKLVAAVLQAFGAIHIYEANNAKQAWTMLGEYNPDIIVLDWIMEGMSGIDLARHIRMSSSSPNPFVPIIMLTGNTQAHCVQEARDAGINEFLAKPVSVNALLMRLLAIIEHPRPFVRTNCYFGPCRRRRDNGEYQGPERRTSALSGPAGTSSDAVSKVA